jgi:hypothetical protein
MSTEEYRRQLFALHPDTNGGDHSRVPELLKLMRKWKLNNTFCACGCGRKIRPDQLKRRKPCKFSSQQCANRHTNNLRRKPKFKFNGIDRRCFNGRKPAVPTH